MTKGAKKKILLVVCTVFAVGALIGIWSYMRFYMRNVNYQKKVNEITLHPTSFTEAGLDSQVSGTYTGEFDADWVGAKVEVEIVKGNIEEIRLVEHKNDRGESAERIVGEMNSQKTTDVENVTGATNSCKVIKKAVENALEKAKE